MKRRISMLGLGFVFALTLALAAPAFAEDKPLDKIKAKVGEMKCKAKQKMCEAKCKKDAECIKKCGEKPAAPAPEEKAAPAAEEK